MRGSSISRTAAATRQCLQRLQDRATLCAPWSTTTDRRQVLLTIVKAGLCLAGILPGRDKNGKRHGSVTGSIQFLLAPGRHDRCAIGMLFLLGRASGSALAAGDRAAGLPTAFLASSLYHAFKKRENDVVLAAHGSLLRFSS